MPLYPVASWIVLAFIAGVALIMVTSLGMFLPIAFTFGFYAVIMIVYFSLILPAQRAGAAQ
jgi:L-asparagine transporter-like permease